MAAKEPAPSAISAAKHATIEKEKQFISSKFQNMQNTPFMQRNKGILESLVNDGTITIEDLVTKSNGSRLRLA